MPHATPRKRVTLDDVAAKAGVSPSAVSVALSRRSRTATLKLDTRKRILEAVAELNYRPNMMARGLANNKSYMMAMLSRRAFDDWIVGISAGVESELQKHSYSLLNYVHGAYGEDMIEPDPLEHENRHLDLSLERRMDGLLVQPALVEGGRTNAARFTALQEEGMPIVQFFGQVLPGIASVRPDHDQGVAQLLDHLVQRGHQRILHVTHEGTEEAKDPNQWHANARRIRQRYETHMHAHGHEPRVLCHRLPSHGEVGFSDRGKEIVQTILEMRPRPTAIFAYTDYLALGIICGFQRWGVRLPDEMAIAGINNTKAAKVVYPALTTIHYSHEEIGRQAAKLLFAPPDERIGRDILIKGELIIRESTQGS